MCPWRLVSRDVPVACWFGKATHEHIPFYSRSWWLPELRILSFCLWPTIQSYGRRVVFHFFVRFRKNSSAWNLPLGPLELVAFKSSSGIFFQFQLSWSLWTCNPLPLVLFKVGAIIQNWRSRTFLWTRNPYVFEVTYVSSGSADIFILWMFLYVLDYHCALLLGLLKESVGCSRPERPSQQP